MLRDSFKSYDYSIPVVLTEFGCVSPAFPTVDGFEAQRTFHDAVFMNLPEYSDYFAGGFAFEYSTENANSMSTSPYPFTTYGPQNYGLGYFSPADCTDAGINCTYQRFPNFDFLRQAFASYDGSRQPTLSTYEVPPNHAETSTCPAGSPGLRQFQWPSDSSANEACPSVSDSRFQCPGQSSTLPTTALSSAPPLATIMASPSTEVPTTEAPTTTPFETADAPSTQTPDSPTDTTQPPTTNIHDGCRLR
ncbi:hypothetical protein F442_05049 [Phytophthora nicotianae P10297]|uniref:Uncharacterized protein n=1 Tax=Phytophthora nicotianae P10297 TaxID=1317064 RepID=W2ZQZ5_PHYNI|nr:hypothetical protein F442_05049 [Phytophthora nicotianae P10297]